jgi:hypothetical protein
MLKASKADRFDEVQGSKPPSLNFLVDLRVLNGNVLKLVVALKLQSILFPFSLVSFVGSVLLFDTVCLNLNHSF